jgi:CspA family cold shock protein
VTFFNELKGYGFATRESGEEVFIHFSQIVGNDGRQLAKGQTVALDVVSGPKGLEGHNVRVQGGSRPQGGGARRPDAGRRGESPRRPSSNDRKPRRKF